MSSLRERSLEGQIPTIHPADIEDFPEDLQKMGFEVLPDEILYEIIELISTPRKHYLGHPNQKCLGTQDLLSVLRCCHRLHRIGEPILYRNFTQTTHKVFPGFIRAILLRPDLAHHVRDLHLTQDSHDTCVNIKHTFTEELLREMHFQLESRPLDDQIKMLSCMDQVEMQGKGERLALQQSLIDGNANEESTSAGVGALDLETQPFGSFPITPNVPRISFSPTQASEDADSLMAFIKYGGRWRALVTYIIYRLPNIKSISIDVVKLGNTQIEPLFQRAINPGTITIPKLRELSLSYSKRDAGSGIDTFLGLLKHASLRTFTADHIREFGWLPAPRNLRLTLTSLTLTRSNLSTSSIDAILKCCSKLEYLKYEHDQVWTEQPFMPQAFATSIRHLKDSLKGLVLYKADAHNVTRQSTYAEFSILGPALVQFKNLTSLSITANLLLGPQKSEGSKWWRLSAEYLCDTQSLTKCLPTSLQNLSLKECGDDIVNDVEALVEQSVIVAPKLKEIVLGFVDLSHSNYSGGFRERVFRREVVHKGLNMDEVGRLEEGCGRKGIVLDVHFS